jgi:hypothetical protein
MMHKRWQSGKHSTTEGGGIAFTRRLGLPTTLDFSPFACVNVDPVWSLLYIFRYLLPLKLLDTSQSLVISIPGVSRHQTVTSILALGLCVCEEGWRMVRH